MTRRMLNNPCPCVACRHRREARHHARGRVAWIGLLGLLACSVPLAAALPGDDPGAMPVPASPVTMTVPREPVLVPGTVRVTGEDGGAIIRWRESEPGGSPNGGRLVNGVRRYVVWGNLIKRPIGPAKDYHSFMEHEQIVEAIASRDRDAAHRAMLNHLGGTRAHMIDQAAG